jgi:hypothetical protein
MREQVGDQLLGVMREIKRMFDPKNLFNPGKLIGDGEFKIDAHFRSTYTLHPPLPFEPKLAFAFKDRSFTGNLEQCNGCGGCRKDAPDDVPDVSSRPARNTCPRAAARMRSAPRSSSALSATIRCVRTSWRRRSAIVSPAKPARRSALRTSTWRS